MFCPLEGDGGSRLNPDGSSCLLCVCVSKFLTSLSWGLSFHICTMRLTNMRQDMGLAHRKSSKKWWQW